MKLNVCGRCGNEVYPGGTITIHRLTGGTPDFMHGRMFSGDIVCDGCLAICREIFGKDWKYEDVIQKVEHVEKPKRTIFTFPLMVITERGWRNKPSVRPSEV